MEKSILLIGAFLSWQTGSRSISEDLSIRLAGAGWTVLTTSSKAGRLARLVDVVRTAWARRREYAVAQIDVFGGPAFVWAEAAAWTVRRAGRPYVLVLHGGSLPDFAARWAGRVRRLLGKATVVVTPSGFLQQAMRPYRADIHVLPNPIDLDAYHFRLRSTVAPQLIWLRAFHRLYNPVMAVRVLAHLQGEFPNVQMVMVGPDKGDGTLADVLVQASKLGVENRLIIPGAVRKADVPQWLDRGDIFLNTTYVDNTPVSVMEAMASGLCVVSTNVGGVPYLVKHEWDGLLVPPDDANAMAAAISRLLVKDGLAERLSRNARARVMPFDWHIVFPQWEALLAAAVERYSQ